MTSFMALYCVTSLLRLKDVSITCKRLRRSLVLAGVLQCNGGSWKKLKNSNVFSSFLCVRIEIDQLQCVNC